MNIFTVRIHHVLVFSMSISVYAAYHPPPPHQLLAIPHPKTPLPFVYLCVPPLRYSYMRRNVRRLSREVSQGQPGGAGKGLGGGGELSTLGFGITDAMEAGLGARAALRKTKTRKDMVDSDGSPSSVGKQGGTSVGADGGDKMEHKKRRGSGSSSRPRKATRLAGDFFVYSIRCVFCVNCFFWSRQFFTCFVSFPFFFPFFS